MTTIYLIRHAEAEGNLYRIAQGQYNSNLSDRGWRQVQALERRFADIPLDAVYSSDLYRTCATAGSVCIPKGLPLHRLEELREICVGKWEQRTWGDIAREDAEQMWNFVNALDRWAVPGAETPQQVQARMAQALLRIAAENDGKTVAVFSHGCAIRLVLALLQGCPIAEVCSKTPLGTNTAVSMLKGDSNALQVCFRDDDSHLRTEAYLTQEHGCKRPSGLETGLRFEALRLPEHAGFLRELLAEAWGEIGYPHPFDGEKLLADAAAGKTLIGYLKDVPAGAVQLGPAPGRISLLCVPKQQRNKGLGIQLIGQAVQWARSVGSGEIFAALPSGALAEAFFRDNGFVPSQGLWRKSIAFSPEILAL